MIHDIQLALILGGLTALAVGALLSGPLWFPLLKAAYLKLLDWQTLSAATKAQKYQRQYPVVFAELETTRNFVRVSYLESRLAHMRSYSRILQNTMNSSRVKQGLHEIRLIDCNAILIPEEVAQHRADMVGWLRKAEEESQPRSLHKVGFLLVIIGSFFQATAAILQRMLV